MNLLLATKIPPDKTTFHPLRGLENVLGYMKSNVGNQQTVQRSFEQRRDSVVQSRVANHEIKG